MFVALLSIILTGFVVGLPAQVRDEASDTKAADRVLSRNPIGRKLTPVDMAEAYLAIETYIYGKPPADNSIRIFDRRRNKTVILTLKSVDKEKQRWLNPLTLSLPAVFESDDGHQYELAFAVTQQRGTDEALVGYREYEMETLDQMVIQDVGIFSVDGENRFEYQQKEDGYWSIKRIK
jgi:hypothetical protein